MSDVLISWFEQAQKLLPRDRPKALDIIYDKVDDWLCAGKFSTCNEFLKLVDVNTADSLLLLAILTVTHAARDKLPYRTEFIKCIRTSMELRGEDYEKILKGWLE